MAIICTSRVRPMSRKRRCSRMMVSHLVHMKALTVFTVTHNGVPLGIVEVPAQSDRVTVAMVPLPGYATLRPLVRAASAALADVALTREADAHALQRGAE